MNNEKARTAESAASIGDLRALLRERFPGATPSRARDAAEGDGEHAAFETGCAALDRIGIPTGAITEIVQTRAGSGGALLIGRLVEGATARGRALALIDGRDGFNPEEFSAAALQRLLWVRASNCTEVLQAADLLLRDGNLPLVIVDLALNPPQEVRRIPSPAWYRLRGLAEESSATLIAVTPGETVPTPHLRILIQQHFTLAAFEQPRGELELSLQVTRRKRQAVARSA